MKKFAFRLQKVLEHRLKIYEHAKNAFLRALQKVHEEEAKLGEFKSAYKNCLLEFIEATRTRFKVRDVGTFYRYISHIKHEIAVQSKTLYEAEQVKERKRQELMEASKNKEILLKLKDRRYQEYQHELLREEQGLTDNAATTKFYQTQKSI